MRPNVINKNMWRYVDWFLVVIVLIIFFYGMFSLINVTAKPFTGDESSISSFFANLDLTYAARQLMFFGIGAGIMFGIMLIDYHKVPRAADIVYWVCIALLLFVKINGSTQRGVAGWIMFGTFGFQPAEFGKLAVILVLAKVLSDKTDLTEEGIRTFRDIFPALWRFVLPTVLIMSQPDMGSALVYVAIFIVLLFFARVHWKVVVMLLVIVAAAIPILMLTLEDYQKTRLFGFFNSEGVSEEALYQVNQAKLAIGSGQMFGKGAFAPGSLSQLGYVPEQHNDFIFAVTIEAFGFMGGLLLILLYAVMIIRMFMLAMRARDDYGGFIIVGVAAMMLFHIVENIGMNVGILPVTGIPLPFFSYGGSNMVTNCIAMGMVLSVDMRRQRWTNSAGRI